MVGQIQAISGCLTEAGDSFGIGWLDLSTRNGRVSFSFFIVARWKMCQII